MSVIADRANALAIACLPSLRPILSLVPTGSPSPSSSSSLSKQALRARKWKSGQTSASSNRTSSTSNTGNVQDHRHAYVASAARGNETSGQLHSSSSTIISRNQATTGRIGSTKPITVSFSRLFGNKKGDVKKTSHPVTDVEAQRQMDHSKWISVEDNIRVEWSTAERK